MEKPMNQDPVEWALFNNWVAEGNARRAFIRALAESEALDALDVASLEEAELELDPYEIKVEVAP